MITLYGFGNLFPAGRGETKDVRAKWALEEAYFERCQARLAWQRTLALYAERIGVSVNDIR
jgi:hypothetical protein